MTIEIQRLGMSNQSILANVAPDVFDDEIEPAFLKAFLEDPRHVMFLAIDDSTVVGMVSAVEYFHPDKPPQLWINEIGVATTYRRKGIGRELVEAVISEAEERGCVYAWLGTDVDNTAAQACFGSVPDGERPQPFLLYEWELED